MTDIQRWEQNDDPNHNCWGMSKDAEGDYVLYADHVEALRHAENDKTAHGYRMYEAGQRDALAAAVQQIKDLPWSHENWIAYDERAAIIAAIKGEQA